MSEKNTELDREMCIFCHFVILYIIFIPVIIRLFMSIM